MPGGVEDKNEDNNEDKNLEISRVLSSIVRGRWVSEFGQGVPWARRATPWRPWLRLQAPVGVEDKIDFFKNLLIILNSVQADLLSYLWGLCSQSLVEF